MHYTKKRFFLLFGLLFLVNNAIFAQVKEILPSILNKEFQPAQEQRLGNNKKTPPALKKAPVEVTDDDLKKNINLTNRILNSAILNQDWNTVERILIFYQDIPNHDAILYLFALGAVQHNQYKYESAITTYNQILYKNNRLSYVRLALAKMQIEDGRLSDAEKNIEQVLADNLVPNARKEAEYFLQLLQKYKKGNLNLSLQMNWSDNANNSSSNKYFYLYIPCTGNMAPGICAQPFQKNAIDLPQKAFGLSSDLSYSKTYNLINNHNIFINSKIGGARYFSKDYYGSQILYAKIGYQWRNYNTNINVAPVFFKAWDLGIPYNQNHALAIDYRKLITKNWRLSFGYELGKTVYSNTNKIGYENNNNSLTIINEYFLNQWYFYNTLSIKREKAKSAEQSAKGVSIALGAAYTFDDKTNVLLILNKGFKYFDAPYANFVDEMRRDISQNIDLIISNDKLRFYGFTPSLNISHFKRKSTIYIMEQKENKISFSLSKSF